MELNSAGQWPSRSRIEDLCPNVINMSILNIVNVAFVVLAEQCVSHMSLSCLACVFKRMCVFSNNLNLYSSFLNIVFFTVLAESCVGTYEISDCYICFLKEA